MYGRKSGKGEQPVREKISESLRREVIVINPDVDTSNMDRIGEAISEKLEIKPAEIYVIRTVRPNYLDHEGTFHIAPLNDPFPKSNAGASFAADIAVKKYADHLPLYRQSKILARNQVKMSPSTLLNYLALGAKKLGILIPVLREEIHRSNYMQADETSMRVLTRDKPGSPLKGCFLVKAAPNERLVLFEYIKTKEKVNILDSLKGFKGYLQVDGNVSYEDKGKETAVTLIHCLVHSRRKFTEALEYDKKKSGYVLEEIKKLYLIERQMDEEAYDFEQKLKTRQELSVPILLALKEWLLDNLQPNLPNNPFQRAVKYMLKRWDGLIEYTNNGILRPDNNLIENQIRPLALGRKNFMFAASHQGAEYAAIFYSFFAMCKINDIDPHRWLTDVYLRIDNHNIQKLNELLPTKDYQFLSV
ncbi:MAG: IS66 family transposase [Saprospiraceae bacterium]|nr:IS66 family transposase [Saprospiraceae bacterium]